MEGGSMTNRGNPELTDQLQAYVSGISAELGRMPEKRRQLLDELARCVGDQIARDGNAKLVFICTHNSRRSLLSQIWATTAAKYFGVAGVETFSGGTEATAFNPRAVAAVERAGFVVEKQIPGANPVYLVRYRDDGPPIKAFSKVFDDRPNPTTDFCAVMTCSHADAACPSVPGTSRRIAITYDDPKDFDGTDQEAEKYDERCRQIAREMFYVFSRVGRPARL
jgi:protein-tyrosine-phosphatase